MSKKYWENIMPKQFNLFSNSYKKEKNHVLSMILKLDKVKIFKKGNIEKKNNESQAAIEQIIGKYKKEVA